MRKNVPSPLTGNTDELTVRWRDVAGRETVGWLARNAPLRNALVKTVKHVSTQEPLTSWDHLRDLITREADWTAKKWICTFGSRHLPLLHAVIRELGGKVPASDDTTLAIRRTLRLILGKEISMSEVNAAAKTNGKKSTRKSTSKKSSVAKAARKNRGAAGGPGRVSAYSGKRIVRLVKENPRRKGTHGYKSWNLLKKGMTYEQYLAAGGRRVDLAWDLAKKNVKLANA
jgi:hypothetical protein